MKIEDQETLNEIFLGKEDPDMAFKKPMTNNLKEILDEILEECPSCKGNGFTAEHEDGCDGNCNFCPIQVQCDHCHAKGYYADKQAILYLINQKEKEARIDELEKISGFSNATGVATVASGELGNLRNRIKQLKEELKGGQDE